MQNHPHSYAKTPIYFLIRALRQESVQFAWLAGASLAVAYLVKEAAIIYYIFPLASCLVVPAWRTWRAMRLAGLVTVIAIAGLLPWFIYVYHQVGEFPLLGRLGGWVLDLHRPAAAAESVVSDELNNGDGFFRGLLGIFSGRNNSLFNVFVLGWLFPVSWVVTTALSLRVWPVYRLIILGLLIILPIVHFNSVTGWRIGYNLPFYQFSCLALAILMHSTTTAISALRGRSAKTGSILGLLLGLWYLLQLVVPNQLGQANGHFLSGSIIAQTLGFKDRDQRGADYFDPRPQQVLMQSMQKISGAVTAVAVDHPAASHALYVKLGGKYPVYALPTIFCSFGGRAGTSYKGVLPANLLPLFYRIDAQRWPPEPLLVLFQEHLIEQVLEKNISHLVTTGFLPGLEDYLADHPAFDEVPFKDSNEQPRWRLWKRNRTDIQAIERLPRVYAPSIRALTDLKSRNPSNYQALDAIHRTCLGESYDQRWLETWFPFAASKTNPHETR